MRSAAGTILTIAALLLVVVVLVGPAEMKRVTPAAFLRIPIDGLLVAALLLVLPPRGRRIGVLVVGAALGVLAVLKIIGLGFSAVLDRPFDPVVDGPFLAAGADYLKISSGRGTEISAVTAAIVAGLLLVALVVLSMRRLGRVAERHRGGVGRGVAVLVALWSFCVLAGAQVVPGVPIAAHDAYDQVHRAGVSLADERDFAREAGADPFRDRPLLAGLRGKDVMVTFIESYGRVALDHPDIAPVVDEVLTSGYARLRATGYTARSGWLTSPVAGGGSWLAQATLLSGLWIDNQQRYRTLTAGDRMTLPGAFAKADWRTVAVMPATVASFPEAAYYGYDQVYASKDLAYRGPLYAFAMMPDQYTLASFQRWERDAPDHPPVMAAIPLISSHAPWAPVPNVVDWAAATDSTRYEERPGAGDSAEIVLQRDSQRLRTDYRGAIAYSLSTVVSYLEEFGDDDLVMVFLGDHQPSPGVTGPDAGRDVPITIVARDPAMLDRIAGWGWSDGLRPTTAAPVWRMDEFRDRFLTAYS
ncbi:MAG: sulfatase [Hamadaea sp.]|nr:sulfatase [Hamadaea sp.]